MERDPKVSVIIPVYNVEKYLRQCLDSICGQTLRDIEIICVDDGSTDTSQAILREYAEKDGRFIILTQKNAGAGAARNKGLAAANGRFIAFMDADDYYPGADVLEAMTAAAEQSGAKVCGGGISADIRGVIKSGRMRGPNTHFTKEGLQQYRDYQRDYGYQAYIYDREMLWENGIVFPDFRRFQDPPFFVRAMAAAGQFYALERDTYCYRWGHQNIAWNREQVRGLINGLSDVYGVAVENGLDLLRERTVDRINNEYKKVLGTALRGPGGEEVLTGLMRLNVRINETRGKDEILSPIKMLLQSANAPAVPVNRTADRALAAENTELKEEIKNIHASASYRIGRAVTWLPRKVRGGIRCYREHGLRYTVLRTKEHMQNH